MQDIENILIDAIKEHKMEAPSVAWPFIADNLRKRKRRRAIWFFLSIVVTALISVGSLLLYNSKNEPKKYIYNNLTIIENNKISKINETNKNEVVNKKDTSLLISNKNYGIVKASINKDDWAKAINTPSTNPSIKYYKKERTAKITSSIITDKEENIFDKMVIDNKTKSRTKVKIANATFSEEPVLLEKNISVTKNELLESETISVINKTNNSQTIQEKDTINTIAKTDTITKKEKDKIAEETGKYKIVKTKVAKEKKWGTYLGLSYGALYISSKNFFKNENKILNSYNSPLSVPTVSQVNANNNAANYQNGKEIYVSLLIKKENKKWQPMFGVNINMGTFNVNAYNATNALLDATTLFIDSTQVGNSVFASRNSIGSNQVMIKNKFVQIGFLIGCNIPVYTFKNRSKILLQTQVIPQYNLLQTIQWYDNTSTRYFTSKKINNNFNITQSTALLWQFNIKNRDFIVGPYFNFNYFKLNKNVNNISNIYTQTVGAQIQIKLKK